jgi:RNA polymerase sigma-70 factor (ECF subfamily)
VWRSSRRAEIERVCADARSVWPDIALDVATFTTYLEEHVPPNADGIHLDQLYLACACARGDRAAIARVDADYVSQLGPILADFEHPVASADDALQVVRLRLLLGDGERPPRIAEYRGVSDLATWIKVAAVRISIGARRSRRAERAAIDEVALDLPTEVSSPELTTLKHSYRAEFKSAFQLGFRELSARERNLIRLQMIDRLSIDRIGALYGVHRATAARWVARARKHLVSQVKRQLRQQLQVSRAELDSIMRIIHSEIDVSASVFLSDC